MALKKSVPAEESANHRQRYPWVAEIDTVRSSCFFTKASITYVETLISSPFSGWFTAICSRDRDQCQTWMCPSFKATTLVVNSSREYWRIWKPDCPIPQIQRTCIGRNCIHSPLTKVDKEMDRLKKGNSQHLKTLNYLKAPPQVSPFISFLKALKGLFFSRCLLVHSFSSFFESDVLNPLRSCRW